MTSTPTSSAHLTCLCGAISKPGTLLSAASIPIHREICHCDMCRHSTGTLSPTFPTLKHAPSDATLTKLTKYQISEKLTNMFCSTCGCHCFASIQWKKWFCLGGIIEQSPQSREKRDTWPRDTVVVTNHKYVLDTIDGGFAPFLLDLGGRALSIWGGGAENDTPDLSYEDVLALPKKAMRSLELPKENELLKAECRCGGVKLLIKRASYSVESSSARHRTSDPTKYLTYLCACRSCRLSSGVSLTPWSIIPPSSIFNGNLPSAISSTSSPLSTTNLQPVAFDYDAFKPAANPGMKLKHYWSSEKVCRSFCGGCGATVAYCNAERPDEIDLSPAIFRAEEGSMARRWLDWEWGRCSFEEECADAELLEAWRSCAKVVREIGPSCGTGKMSAK